jgi:hypothetical protein
MIVRRPSATTAAFTAGLTLPRREAPSYLKPGAGLSPTEINAFEVVK